MKKGFTLIELLAVIVILGILGLIIIPNVAGTLKNQKNNLYNIQIKNIEEAAKGWAGEHFYSLPTNDNEIKSIYLKDLIGFIDIEINNPKTNKNFGKCLRIDITKVAGAENYTYKVDESTVDNDSGCGQDSTEIGKYTDSLLQGNDPNLLNNSLTPVVYNGTNWVVADTTQEWYNYSKQEWANAVILNSGVTKSIGDVIKIPTSIVSSGEMATTDTSSDITAMYVWIPRYEYKITGTYGTHLNGTAGTESIPGQIEVRFIPKSKTTADSGYILHPAFTWDNNSDGTITNDEHISGIWVGKFDTTGTAINPTILPNMNVLKSQNISAQFTIAQKFGSYLKSSNNVDSHMMKNSEWGSVAYLTQSIYGKYGNTIYSNNNKQIYKNNSNNGITGRSGDYTFTTSSSEGTCTYDNITNRKNGTGSCGGGASTTGNITGVYDMSGGLGEYVMGYLTTASTTFGATSYSNKAGFTTAPASKYYDSYTATNLSTACKEKICYGHALSETKGWQYGAEYSFDTYSPWLVRSGNAGSVAAGLFSIQVGDGSAGNSFRTILLMPGM